MQVVFLPGRVPSMNEIVAARASWRGAYSKLKREYEEDAVPLLRALGKYQRVNVTLHIVEPHSRRDPDGICSGASKFVLDALVAAGVIPDDSQKHVATLSFLWSVNADDPGCFVMVSEAP